MKFRTTAMVARRNIFRGLLLAATLELPWPRRLWWLWSAADWVSALMVVGSVAVLVVWVLLNAHREPSRHSPYGGERPVTGDRMPPGVNQAWEMACVRVGALAENRAGSLRYLGPPPVYMPGYGRTEPWRPAPTCGWCGQVIVPVRTETHVFYFCPDCTDAPEALRAQCL